MAIKLKPLHEQVLLIIGATSDIGLATVHRAVEQGAKVFMVARNEDELQNIQDEMRRKGYDTAFAVVDVAEIDQIQSAADRCISTFGRIDTFVNNAGISVSSELDTSIEEAKRLFDTNFWGVVNGCKVAVSLMKDSGGVIMNIGSVPSKVALPIQGLYSASEHAVKGYTDSLRRELRAEKAPIQFTLIMPSAVDTPYPEHGADVVARAILKCAIKPTRELGVGPSSFFSPFMDRFFPRYEGHMMQSSLMTEAVEKKGWLKVSAIAGGLGFLFLRKFRSLRL